MLNMISVARWENLIPSFPWIAPGWRAWGRNPRKGREESNLESGLNGPNWQCNKDHGRRLRSRTYFIEENKEATQEWDDEDWNNVYYPDNQDPEAPKKERD